MLRAAVVSSDGSGGDGGELTRCLVAGLAEVDGMRDTEVVCVCVCVFTLSRAATIGSSYIVL